MSPDSKQSSPSICLVTWCHVSTNPRLVKEADALHNAGYRVHIIAGRSHAASDKFDAAIFKDAQWSYTLVDFESGVRTYAQKVIRKITRFIVGHFPNAPLWLHARAHHAAVAQISHAASRVPADLYIGHTLAGLIAAANAAHRNRARLGFDAEDFHTQETAEIMADSNEQNTVRRIEKTLLPRCIHLTAAAPLIAESYAQTYGIPLPVTVQNVFPLSESPEAPSPIPEAHQPARFYWFSQNIGEGRGIEAMIQVLARMKTPADLTLRGDLFNPAYKDALNTVALETEFKGQLHFCPPEKSTEMARLAADHDIGLAIEPNYPPNREVCLSNKFYTYLLAGLPIAYTKTRAQCALGAELGDAAMLINFDDPNDAANKLDDWLNDNDRYTSARRTSWHFGKTRFNWDYEQKALLDAVSCSLKAPKFRDN